MQFDGLRSVPLPVFVEGNTTYTLGQYTCVKSTPAGSKPRTSVWQDS